ncbi:hypothetical protein HYALB_00003153 [Hymenoscyphus albidus]|uniref:DUF6594 domain-containing protein n=1 Tax=Hymenoscyphus albidus TaxID=595503 RepID=A0A9N9PXF7_9HELO|nr:hypothetical protein HYALB_00003153 [Hymenoscyphus albidus]
MKNCTEDVIEKGEVVESMNAQPIASSTSQRGQYKEATTANELHGNSTSKLRLHVWYLEKRRVKQAFKVRPDPTVQKYSEGYPYLTALLNFEENFMIYRRFGILQARNLLYKQHELSRLEAELARLDILDQKFSPSVHRSRDNVDPEDTARQELHSKIEQTFKEYAELLIIARDLAYFNPPPEYSYRNIKDYFDKTNPVAVEDAHIYHKEDLVTLKPGREHSWLDSMVERILHTLTKKPSKLNKPIYEIRDFSSSARQHGTTLFSKNRIEITVSIIIMLTILALLVCPIYILSKLTGSTEAQAADGTLVSRTIPITIVILGVFTALFSTVLSLFTRAKRHEILASAAAYCAVLVVYIGNLGQK